MDLIADVSVVIPCFKCAGTVGRAVNSVLNQTVRPAELILIDDGSGDSTSSILENIQNEYPDWIKLLRNEHNRGIAYARNSGWDAASQKYVAFLDADDAWHPRKIEIQYGYMTKNSNVILTGHRYKIIEKENPNWDVSFFEVTDVKKSNLLMKNQFVTPSAMIKRDAAQRFISGKRHMEDHLLWMELVCSGAKVVRLEIELVAIYKNLFGVSGLSSQLWKMEIAELYNYAHIKQMKWIGNSWYIFLVIYSILKYIRRILIVYIYRPLVKFASSLSIKFRF